MRKPAFFIYRYENKGADQLHGKHAADQLLCFCYIDRTTLYFLNPEFQAYSHLLWLYSLECVGPGLETPNSKRLVIYELFYRSVIQIALYSMKMSIKFCYRRQTYLKTPKILDTRKLSCYTPQIQIKGPNLMVFLQQRLKWNSKQ